MAIHFDQDHWDAMLAHARQGAPLEVCGLIGGVFRNSGAWARGVHPIPNVAPDPQHRFEMDRPAMVRAIFNIQRAGHEVVAVYHSHPTHSAAPSADDVQSATWPDAIYVIIAGPGTVAPEVRAWTIRRGAVQRVPVLIGPSAAGRDAAGNSAR